MDNICHVTGANNYLYTFFKHRKGCVLLEKITLYTHVTPQM